MRCKADTKRGRRCRNRALRGSSFCCVHEGCLDIREVLSTGVGAVVGHAVAPGPGGLAGSFVGGVIGNVTHRFHREFQTPKKKVFVSFDYDHDKKLKDFIIGQSKLDDSPFEIIDHSLKEAAPEPDWEHKARAAIENSDIVIVMVGPYTYQSKGVLNEIQLAREADKEIVQIIGYRNGDYNPVPNAGRLYRWNWANLKNILS